jgi:aryl-alcohol dehydrogenase-like predicted oxidoreductase
MTSVDDMEEDDRRRDHPRFEPENLARNVALVASLRELAKAEGCTPAQLALAWVLAQGDDVLPIPGTRRRCWLEENTAALDLAPSAETLATLDRIFAAGAGAGTRYPAGQMKRVNI